MLFAALIAAMLDSRIRPGGRGGGWSRLLGVALALSHYSTTYVAVTVLGLLLLAPVRAVLGPPGAPGDRGGRGRASLATLAGAVIWYGPVTHSESHLSQVAQTVDTQGLDILPNRTPGSSLISRIPAGQQPDPDQRGRVRPAHRDLLQRHQQYVTPLRSRPAPGTRCEHHVPEPPVKWRAGYTALTLCLLIIEQLANLLAAIGALLMVSAAQGVPAHPAARPGRAGRHAAAHGDPVQRYPGRRLRAGAGPAAGHGVAGRRLVLDVPGAHRVANRTCRPGSGCWRPAAWPWCSSTPSTWWVRSSAAPRRSICPTAAPRSSTSTSPAPETRLRPLAGHRVPVRRTGLRGRIWPGSAGCRRPRSRTG